MTQTLVPAVFGICLLVGGLAAVPAGGTSALEAGSPGTPEPSTNETVNVTLYDADDGRFDGAGPVRTAIENGTLEPADRLVGDETLVAVVESRTPTTTHETGPGFTAGVTLAAVLVVALSGRRFR